MYALTVDRRRSRSEGAELDMAGARDRLNQRHPEAVLPWSISAGDELQALFGQLVDAAGKEIALNRGQTWIAAFTPGRGSIAWQ